MGFLDFLEDVGKAVVGAGETVVHAAEDVGKAVTGVATTVSKPILDAAKYGARAGIKAGKGGGAVAHALNMDGSILDKKPHLRPTRPRKPKGGHNTGKPTQNMEVLPGGSSVPSQPPPADNRPSSTVDKGPFNGGKSKVTDLFDVSAWNLKYNVEISNIRKYSFDTHPQTVDKAPTLNYNNKASRQAYITWARAEYNHLKLAEKRKKDYDTSEKKRKEDVKTTTKTKKETEDKKKQEAIDKADAIKKANNAGVKREADDDTAKKILEEIALNKKFPVLSKRVTEYFNKNKPSTQRFLEPFFGSVKTRQERLTRDAKAAGISVEKMLETWSGDYVGKLVNDYIKQMLVKEKGKYKWTIPTTPIPANDTVYPYTEKFRKLLLKARKYDKRNLPIKYLGMKLADNEFLKTPKVRIGSKAKIAKEDADVKALLDKDAKAVKDRKDAKVKETKKFNEIISEKEKRDKADKALTPESQKKKEFETYATENQKTYPQRNFLTDSLKSGDLNRYSLDSQKENRDYAVDSVLAHTAYSSKIPDRLLGDWKHVTDASTNETKVFFNQNENKIKMAFKGTSKQSEVIGVDFFSILLSHSLTKLSGVDKHFQRAIKKYNELRSRYPTADFSFTGHSLGARTAIVVADYEQGLYKTKTKRLGDPTKGNNFNSLGGKVTQGSYKKSHVSGFATGAGFETFLTQTAKSISNFIQSGTGVKWAKPNVQLYRVTGDPLSLAEFGQSHKTKLYKIPQQTSMNSGGVNCSPHSSLNFLHKDFWSLAELKSCGAKSTPNLRGAKQSNPSGKQTADSKAAQRKPQDDYDKPDV